MKSIQILQAGGPEVMSCRDTPDPEPQAGEVIVRIEAIGVNFIDIYVRSGLYPREFPFTPGFEAAGIVEAAAADVRGFRRGDRVAYGSSLGAYAEMARVPAAQLVPVPSGVTSQAAAASMLQGMTAHYLSRDTYPIQSGDTVLVHAAAGGVGLLLVQMAKMRGARVIGTVSTREKAELASRAGADEVILYTRQDFAAEVKRLTGGEGAAAVYDSVGQATFQQSLDCLRLRGVLVLFGQSSGPVAPFDPQILNEKGSLFLTRPSLFHYIASREALLRRGEEVLKWVADGQLELRIGETFPLAEAARAHEALESRRTTGKILLLP